MVLKIDSKKVPLEGGGGGKTIESYGDFYKTNYTTWYKTSSYAFKAIIDKSARIFHLPINPQNLTIVTHYATNTIATLYSTVEEHSEQRYFDIAIQGTTGFAPKFVNDQGAFEVLTPSPGRQSYQSGEILSNLDSANGFFQKTLGQFEQAINRASDAFATVKRKNKTFQAGVFTDNNGYLAFHNLYKFFLAYKKSAAEGKSRLDYSPEESPLVFINYKDGNRYSCSIQRFTLERNAENPMLYNYNIQLRAYNIMPLTSQMGDSAADTKQKAGLNEDSTTLASRLKGGIGNAKKAINALSGAFRNLGR